MKPKYVSLLLAGMLIVSSVCEANLITVQAESHSMNSAVKFSEVNTSIIAKTHEGYTDEELCKLTAKNYGDSEVIGVRNIIQYSKSTGKSISLVKKSSSESIVTNGKYLYYSKFEGDKGVIYKMDLETKKTSKVVSAKNYVLLGGTDKYLYIGKADFDTPAPMYKMQVYNMSTKQIKKSGIDYFVGEIQVENKKILACQLHFDADNYRFDVMNELGKSIFKDKAVYAFIIKGKVFYNHIFYSGNENTQEYYRYDISKKSKKKISKKVYEENEKQYLDY